ncbi:hypothetical protein Taro_031939 [Colocasia esculenta]|uniref:Alpha-ketoglutarate-dependent dioxygenase AlkB-like domain-containing protein n=1 Tax=Colocasia esculenta TaxID=4460 RepID=A0A843W7X6_COLES|nr:hypothetical protein [Colocasia esculenta]
MARFASPVAASTDECPNLYVANCGPAVGFPLADVAAAFAAFGEVAAVHPADGTGARVVVCFADAGGARAAAEALGGGAPCAALGGRVLHIRYSLPRPPPRPVSDATTVALEAAELGVPGVFLVKDFVTAGEEQELVAAVDAGPWKRLAKRRVQHYGYEFLYETRNVDWKQSLGELPSFVSSVLERIKSFPSGEDVERHPIDQLTVNEYYPGVGLSPHIDTHSAFGASIFSLSLLGSCVMEFRKYSQGTYLPQPAAAAENEEDRPSHCSNFIRKAIFLPPRSMLLMSGEGRYAWHHYIPHHKIKTTTQAF